MEVEVKAKMDDFKEIKKKLKKKGAVFEKVKSQEDLYFKEKGKEKEPQGPGSYILRIRKEDDRNFFTLKGLTEEKGAWEEYETEVSDPKEVLRILERVGFTNMFTIHKKRIEGEFKKFGICLDKVKELGSFVEVELMLDDERNKKEAKQEILSFLSSLGISEEQIEERGYARIVSERMGIEFKDT